jgi:hypothetical protein
MLLHENLNQGRARTAGKILAHAYDHYGNDCNEEVIVDLLTDLMHFCFKHDINFDDLHRLAVGNFDYETGEEMKEKEKWEADHAQNNTSRPYPV